MPPRGATAVALLALVACAQLGFVTPQAQPVAGNNQYTDALAQESAARATAEASLAQCRSQFQTYADQAAAAIEQCNGNIHMLNEQAVDLGSKLRQCVDQVTATPAPVECPPASAPAPAPAPASADADAQAESGERKPWLVIGLPSVPRRNNMDYLSATIDFILDQLPADPAHPMFGQVKIVVMNNGKGKPHAVFDDNRQRLDPSKHPKGSYVEFAVNPNQPHSAKSLRAHNANVPSAKVQQQSADVINLVRYAAPLGHYYLFMEDDFRLCPRGMYAIQSLMEKATRHFPNWIILRISFGLNGALLHSKDALAYVDYLEKHIARRPPDHMLVEWFAGEKPESARYKGDRPHIAFRHNLLEHLGDISSLRTDKTPVYAACYEQLLDPVLFEVEAFKPAECGHQDMWPCPPKGARDAGPVMPWKEVGKQIERIKRLPEPVRY